MNVFNRKLTCALAVAGTLGLLPTTGIAGSWHTVSNFNSGFGNTFVAGNSETANVYLENGTLVMEPRRTPDQTNGNVTKLVAFDFRVNSADAVRFKFHTENCVNDSIRLMAVAGMTKTDDADVSQLGALSVFKGAGSNASINLGMVDSDHIGMNTDGEHDADVVWNWNASGSMRLKDNKNTQLKMKFTGNHLVATGSRMGRLELRYSEYVFPDGRSHQLSLMAWGDNAGNGSCKIVIDNLQIKLASTDTTANNDAIIKAKIAEAVGATSGIRLSLAEYHAEEGFWPVAGSEGLQTVGVEPEMVVPYFEDPILKANGRFGIALRNIHEDVNGLKIWFAPEVSNAGVRWACLAEEAIAERWLPAACTTSADPEGNYVDVIKAKIGEAIVFSNNAKLVIADNYQSVGGWPQSGDDGLASIGVNPDQGNAYVDDLQLHEDGVLSIQLTNIAEFIDGKVIEFVPSVDNAGISWSCDPIDIDDAYLPQGCQENPNPYDRTLIGPKIAEAMGLTGGIRITIAEYYQTEGDWPATGEAGLTELGINWTEPYGYIDDLVLGVEGRFGLVLGNIHDDVNGLMLWFAPQITNAGVTWDCSADEGIASEYLPEWCQH